MTKGHSPMIIPFNEAVNEEDSADLLNVSRPFLVGLLEAGEIPYQRLGDQRRILFQDLMAFKAKTDATRADAMCQLTEEAQELDMGY
jgi:excisionase family DNA binding protein